MLSTNPNIETIEMDAIATREWQRQCELVDAKREGYTAALGECSVSLLEELYPYPPAPPRSHVFVRMDGDGVFGVAGTGAARKWQRRDPMDRDRWSYVDGWPSFLQTRDEWVAVLALWDAAA
jgi:hypothetical protein